MKRFAAAVAVCGAGVFSILGAVSPAHADGPAIVQCPEQAGSSALADGSARPSPAQPAEVVTCRYGTEGDAAIEVTYGARTGTFPIGCDNVDQRTRVTVGTGFNPVGALYGDHFSGTFDDPHHALRATWTTTHAGDATAVRAAALVLAAHLAPLARGCGGRTVASAPSANADATPPGSTGNKANTPLGVALVGGGLLVTAGGLLLGARSRGRLSSPAELPPADDRVVSGPDAINVLVQSGLVQPVTRPDGTVGYQPVGDLVQFNAYGQWRVPLTGQSVVDGEQFHNLGALAYHERPDGTFDSATIVVGVQPAAPPAPPPSPPVTVPAPQPVDPEATLLGDALAREFLPADLARAWVEAVDPPPYLPWLPSVPAPSAPVDHTDAWNRAAARRDAGMDEQQQNLTSAKHWGWLETGGELTGWIADRAIDVLANMGGPGAKVVKDVYTVTSKIGKGLGEAIATGDGTHVAEGAAEGAFDLAWGKGVDKLQALDKIPGLRADTPAVPSGTATRVIGQVLTPGTPTRIVTQAMNPTDALKAGFKSWVRDTAVRDPVKHTIGF